MTNALITQTLTGGVPKPHLKTLLLTITERCKKRAKLHNIKMLTTVATGPLLKKYLSSKSMK